MIYPLIFMTYGILFMECPCLLPYEVLLCTSIWIFTDTLHNTSGKYADLNVHLSGRLFPKFYTSQI